MISCGRDSKRYHFPHDLAQEILREARNPQAGSGKPRTKQDWELKIFYTSDRDTDDKVLGSVVTVLEEGHDPETWRLGDTPQRGLTAADLRAARLMA